MKKLFLLLLSCILIFSFFACNKVSESDNVTGQEEKKQETGSYEDSPAWDGLHLNPEPIDYMGVKIEKNASITEEQREFFFEFARTYCLDAMRTFEDGKQVQLDDFKWYCVTLYPEKINELTFPGEIIEKTASELFGWSYGLKEGGMVPLEIGSYSGPPLSELINYKEEKVGDQTLVTLRYANYSFWQLSDCDKKRQEEHELYAVCREQIIKGKVTQEYSALGFYDVQYYTQDGKTPIRFVSWHHHSYNEVPEFD